MSETVGAPERRFSGRDGLMLAGGILLAVLLFAAWTFLGGAAEPPAQDAAVAPAAAEVEPSPEKVTIAAEILENARIAVATATVRPRMDRVTAPGVVQPNELQMQDITPLVSGRVERVAVVEGSPVMAGDVLLTMSSPEVAELQGNLRAAEARDVEAEATLIRTRKLVELGAGAGKDLFSAEAARGAAQAEVAQLRDRLQALGASAASDSTAVSSTTSVRAPASATVLERLVNPGQWIEAGTAVMKLANLSTLWVIVNVPEARLPSVTVGAPADIIVRALDGLTISGRVNFIESQLDEETRTARVRVEVPNPAQRLRVGMFVEAAIQGRRTGDDELLVPSTAMQRIGERTIVFLPTEEVGTFAVRDVEFGDEIQGMRAVRSGLEPGERVVSNGGFALKSQLLKGQFGEDEELAGEAEP